MKNKIPEKVVNRLTLYHSILIDCLKEDIKNITSPQIAKKLGIDDSQVRKDFHFVNNIGRCRVGYSVKELKENIEKTLGFAVKKDAFIVGAGYLGLALAKYENFSNYGLNILALFDNDPHKLDLVINSKQVYHASKLPNLAKRLGVDIAILTVPREQAQKVADFLIESEIKYIWNFTPAVLEIPPHVKVWNENLIASFLQFICKDFSEE